MRGVILVVLALLAAGCAAEAPAADPTLLRIAIPGTGRDIPARLCRPEAPGPVPLAVINHGSPANAAGRARMAPQPCTAEAVRWFLARGFAVLLPLRRGYGPDGPDGGVGGGWAEGYGGCASPDYVAGGRQTARDIAAAVALGRSLPGIRPEGVLVVGQSAGGWGGLALAADPPEGVVAVVNMAGGRGGWAGGQPHRVCAPERLAADAGRFGQTARLPTLWIYTANDTFFGPDLAQAMHQAFTAAGGRAQFAALPAFGADGHSLFFGRGGSAVWGPVVEPFLAERGYRPR